jgi:hypothetical protein
MKSETMHRMDAMRAAGLTPDLTLCVDTLASVNGKMVMIPNPRWVALYNDSISVHIAYDQSKHGHATLETFMPAITPEPTITPDFSTMTSEEIYNHIKKPKTAADIEGTIIDITPIPKQERIPMDRKVLIATARGYAKEFDDKDHYFAWLLNELADALEQGE